MMAKKKLTRMSRRQTYSMLRRLGFDRISAFTETLRDKR